MTDVRAAITKLLMGKPGGPHPGGIAVYHSSPHDFDKFDWSKLRTGEGANMYGAGFYFAENPAVSGQGGQYWKQFVGRFPNAEMATAEMLASKGFDREAAIASLQREIDMWHGRIENVGKDRKNWSSPTEERAWLDGRLDWAEKQRDLLTSGPVGPRTYEVNINARPELMLDWDRPIKGQTPHVKEVLRNFGWDPESYTLPSGALAPRIGGPTGKEAYRELGKPPYPTAAAVSDDVRASEMLREAGIPGIRYLDEGSRSLSDRLHNAKHYGTAADVAELEAIRPTYNYVVTDPSKLDIFAKYGVVGGAAVPVMSGAFDQSRYEAQ